MRLKRALTHQTHNLKSSMRLFVAIDADEPVITLGTAKWHVHNILQKLGVNNRTQATIHAQELGLF